MNSLQIGDFLLVKDYSGYQDYLVLMNTTKKFKFIKKLTVFYMLGIKYSSKYYWDNSFRKQIHKNIFNPLAQIGLVYLFDNKISNPERLIAHTLILVFCPKITNVAPLVYSDTLIIYGCNGISNITPLLINGCIKNLYIDSCVQIKNLSKPLIINNI